MLSSAAIVTGGAGINYAYGLDMDTQTRTAYLAGFITPSGPYQIYLAKYQIAAPTLASISLVPSTSSFLPGQSVQFTANGTFSDLSARVLGPSDGLTWSVASSSVATTTSNGLATAWASGATLLTVSSGAVNASAPLVVTPALPAGAQDQAIDIARRGASLYAVGASSQGSRGLDLWVAKLNASDLAVTASMLLNGSAGGDDEAKAAAFDASGNLYVLGRSSAAGLGPVVWLGKFDSALTMVSSATYPIPTPAAGAGTPKAGLVVAPGGNIFAVDYIPVGGVFKILLAQFTPALAFVSSTTFYNGYNANIGFGLDVDASGNLYAVGSVPPAPATSNDIWVGKFNSSLAFVTSATVAGAGGNTDQSYSAKVDPTSSFLFVSGNKNNTGAIGDLWVAKYSLGLNLLAQASFRGTGTGGSIAFDTVVSDTRVYVSGTWNVAAADGKIYVAELDYSLNMVSSAAIVTGGAGINYAYGLDVDTQTRTAYLAGFITPSGPYQIYLAKYQFAAPTLTLISLSQSSATLILGQSVQLTANGTFSDSSSRALGPSDGLTWSVASGSVAATTSNGLVTAMGAGATLLTVSSGAVSASIPVAVSTALTNGTWDQASAIARSGSSLYVVGYTSQASNGLDIWVSKLNASNLATISSVTLNSSGAADDDARGVALDASGNVYVTGLSSAPGIGYAVWMGKFDPSLNLISSRTYNLPSPAGGGAGAPRMGLVVAPSGDVFISGYLLQGGVVKILVAQFTSALALVSSTTFFNGFNANAALGLDRDSSGNLYAVGYVAPAPATSGDIWVGKFNSSLVFLTSASMAGAGGNSDQAYSAKVDPTNTYLFVSGIINNTGLIGDLWLAKYDLNLNLLKQASFRGSGNGASEGIAEVVTDTRVYVGGNWHTTSLGNSVYLGVFDYSLNALSSATYDTGSASNDDGWALAVDTVSRFAYVAGYVTPVSAIQTWVGKFGLPPAPLTSFTLNQSSVTLTPPQSAQIAATGVFEGGSSRALGLSDALQWSVSLGSSVATVSPNGLVTAVASGAAVLTVSSGTLSVSVPVSVILGPGTAGTLSAAALGVSSISWTWTAVADAQSYSLYRATNTASLIASTPTLTYVQTALLPNRAYGAVYAGVNAIGQGPLSAAATAYTWAAPPTGTAYSGVWATSATISWNLGTNPVATLAEVQRSTDDAAFTAIFSSATLSMVDPNLLGCTSYYYRVRNRNAVDVASPFDSEVWFRTMASTPAAANSLTAEPVTGNRITLSWVPSVTEGITQYRLYYDNGTGAVSYAAPLAVFTSTETSWTTGALVSSAAYTFALRAKHRCGVEETNGVFAMSGSTGTLADVRAFIKTPDSGKRIRGNRITVMAELAAGVPNQVSQISFQSRPTGTSSWADMTAAEINHPNPDLDSPYFIHVDVTGWPAGSYDLRAVAVNVAGSSDTAPSAITIIVDPVTADITENVVSGKVEKQQSVDDAVPNTIVSAGAALDDPSVKVLLPAGALGGSTVTVTMVSNPTISTGPPAGGFFVGSAVQIDFADGTHFLAGGLNASLTLSYPEGAGDPRGLQIHSLDPVMGQWSALQTLSVDTNNRTITCATPHFSIFAVINGAGVAAPDLSRVRVYPVPYKPNGADPNEGKPYSAGDPTSGIIFDNLPQAVSIRIYTLSGRPVAQFDTTTCTTGKIQWDAANSDGRGVASGGYFAVISSPGNKSVVKKLAVIR
ncbi:MAG: Ig-like domain-containing protein [Elusimicrobia bacterium]|nr:Ig-like domain-containing protein [Elusimicrobiota bacterium]